jgi:hypothetical protein
MDPRLVNWIGLSIFVPALLLSSAMPARTQQADAPYPTMAPLEQYLMADRTSEIALARTAAPKAISDNAEIMVLDREGYKTAVKGTNGFVCMVERAWTGGLDFSEFFDVIEAALDKKELPAIETGAMCYMMSKQQYLNDRAGHWHPHLMFFVPFTEPKAWGADLPGSPILADTEVPNRMTVFMVPVSSWSDGTADTADKE